MKAGLLMAALLMGAGAGARGQAAPAMERDHAARPAIVAKSLTVTVEGKAVSFSVEDVRAMPQTTVKVKNGHTQAEETYTGVSLGDLLAKCGFAYGGATAKTVYHSYVRAEGTDGYWVLYSASELMPMLRETGSVVAIAVDGKPLEAEGGFKMVIAGERRPARWVRNLKSLTVVTAE